MGANNGTGQPYWFRCSVERSTVRGGLPEDHVVTLTGRSRPTKGRGGGARVSDRDREYQCSCGHKGWSRHVDLAMMAGEPRLARFPAFG
jgi:hypothetical protein